MKFFYWNYICAVYVKINTFYYFGDDQVISNLSLSKEEFRHDYVKEAFKVITPEVKDNKNDEDKHAKIVQEIEEFNRRLEYQELLIHKLETSLRELRKIFIQQQEQFAKKYDVWSTVVEEVGVHAEGQEEGE